MKYDEYLLIRDELLMKPNAPYIFHNVEFSKAFYDELVARTASFVITYHDVPGFQAVCITDKARKRLSSLLKNQLWNLSVRIDRLKCCIDEIEDSFASAGRSLS